MKLSSAGFSPQPQEGEKKCLNSELWHACAGPLVSLPAVGSHVVYFPQGHSEQVAASTNREVDAQMPNHPTLPPHLICQLHDVTMHADVETDEVYAQMTLQPLSSKEQKDIYLPEELGMHNKQPTNYFCKILTASDTSTHGGFSVPRRAAEKVFPPLDFSLQPPAQELIAWDLHDNEWKFRHIFRGQPKRHLLTTGWSVFVSAKRLIAGDAVLFIWNEKNQLLLGIRRATRPQTVMPSSVISSDSMHLGLLAAAAHAAATNSRFTIFYNPRACPSEFVIPLGTYIKAVHHTRVSVGMRFRMLFETEESSVRRYMGTITGISDYDLVKWPSSHWRSVKVGWDESTAGERQPRVSLWEIEPLTTFPMYPSPFTFGLKRPWPSAIRDDGLNVNRHPRLCGDNADRMLQSFNFQGMGMSPWSQGRLDPSMLGMHTDMYQVIAAAALQDMRVVGPTPSPLLQLQQSQIISGSTSLMQPESLQQSDARQGFFQGAQGSMPQIQSQALSQPHHYLVQPQLRHSQFSISNKPQKPQLQHPQQQMVNAQRLADFVSTMPQLTTASQSQIPLFQSVFAFPCQRSFPHSNGCTVSSAAMSSGHSVLASLPQAVTSNMLHMVSTDSLASSAVWQQKLTAVPQGTLPQIEQSSQTIYQNVVSLPPFPGKECSVDEDGSMEQQNHVLFRGNVDSSPMMIRNGLRVADSHGESSIIPFSNTNFVDPNTDYSANPATTTSSCFDESPIIHSSDNLGQENPPNTNRTFVKVYKSGSLGRSVDIKKFSSYMQLRCELARMFGLEGQLEDPLRSGWQLVFVDKENDVLLLGDDPWTEFVNSVWCIKILSPLQVQQSGRQGLELLNSVPSQTLSNGTYEDYSSQQDPQNLNSRIACLGSLEF